MNPIDFEGEAETAPDDQQLKVIAGLAARQLEQQKLVADLEIQLAAAEKKLYRTQAIDLPDAMKAAGCTSFTLATGEGIKIDEGISASVPKERKPTVCAWLRANGAGDLVKEEVSVSFGKGKEEEAKALVEDLIEKGLIPTAVTDVNTGTLKSWVKEQKKAGIDLPLELLGVTEYKKAVISPPKPK